jgi:hypothetical protein
MRIAELGRRGGERFFFSSACMNVLVRSLAHRSSFIIIIVILKSINTFFFLLFCKAMGLHPFCCLYVRSCSRATRI